MEGRAIARPNQRVEILADIDQAILQWRAEQSLGQTWPPAAIQVDERTRPSMEGRAIARPNGPLGDVEGLPAEADLWCPSMEGRAIARPNQVESPVMTGEGRSPSMEGTTGRPNRPPPTVGPTTPPALQWRAEQSLGQTCLDLRVRESQRQPSMEGRAIARPNNVSVRRGAVRVQPTLQWRAEQSLGQTACDRGHLGGRHYTFNGGPSNRSAKPHRGLHVPAAHHHPSMEGRAIARPNRAKPSIRTTACSSFNGGPSNRSAKPGVNRRWLMRVDNLQWRAEQSLGPPGRDTPPALAPTFNGGPSNRSAKLGPTGTTTRASAALQWRAEQSLGQTRSAPPVPPTARSALQWRAEQSLGQTGDNPPLILDTSGLQWRAEQSLGQTPRRRHSSPFSWCTFNGGPSNRSAKPDALECVGSLALIPSMEGRAIARPNACSLVLVLVFSIPFNGGPSNRSAKPCRRPR